MSALTTSAIVFVLVFGGAILGGRLRSVLPTHHLAEESKNIINLAIGLIATLTALVLGLLLGSVKSSFDAKNDDVKLIASQLLLLDQVLAQYGPAAAPARTVLHDIASARNDAIRKRTISTSREAAGAITTGGLGEVLRLVRELPANSRADELVQRRAFELSGELAKTRWLFAETFDSTIPTPFVIVLISWLFFIFLSFGLFAPFNGTVITTLFVCALSVSGALFLILEMDAAFSGFIHVSFEPLTDAVGRLGK